MVYVQFEYLYKKRNIFIQGEIDDKTFRCVTLLKKVTQRFYLEQVINFLIRLLNSESEQLGSILVVLLSVLSTEVLSHVFFNTQVQGGFGHLVLVGLVLYAFVIHILFSKQYKIYLVGVLEVMLGIGVGVVAEYKIQDYHITLCFLLLNSTCLLIGIFKKLLEEELEIKIFSIFEFESNFLIAIYFIAKFLHFYYPYLKGDSLDAFNLIPVIICVAFINALKIWNLFDFNPVYLISFLISAQKQGIQQMELSLIDDIFHLGDDLHNKKFNKNQQNDEGLQIEKEQEECASQMMDKGGFLDKKTQLPSKNLADTDSIVQSLDERSNKSNYVQNMQILSKQESSSPYTQFIWLSFALNFLFACVLITLIVFKKYSDSQLYLMSLGMFKCTLLMFYCEQQSIRMGQDEKHAYFYLLHFLSDIFMGFHIVLMYVFYDNLDYKTDYGNFSLIVHVFVPFMTRLMYRGVSEDMTQAESNGGVQHFYLFWVFLLGVRQTLVIVGQAHSGKIYLLVDSFLLIYFLVVLLMVGKGEFYKWMWQEVQKMRKMKKYKLYVMQSLRNWRYDITELNQSFFLINCVILFLGYNEFRKQNYTNSCAYSTDYFIICSSAIIIHLLQLYNNFYTQAELDHESKPKYSPYFSYLLLILGSGIYAAVAFLPKLPAQHTENHKRWSILCLTLSIFLAFTNIFSHYSYQTVQQFRHASKPINLVISYFIFYYPFITVFTVFFFTSDLQTEYIFRYAIAGFAYLTFASVTMGILVHAILNLTQKSKRTLFLIKAFSEQFKKINMKEDPEFISMIQNLYDLMDGDSHQLLEQLKSQKFSKIMFHDDANIQYDYSIVEPDKKDQENEFVKVFAENIKRTSTRNLSKKFVIHSVRDVSLKKIQTKSQFFKNNSKQESPLRKIIGLNIRKSTQENKNKVQIKRLIEAVDGLSMNNSIKLKKSVEGSQEFKEILKSEEKVKESMQRFFHFLSDPQDCIDYQIFCFVNTLLKRKRDVELKTQFNRFSQNGQTLNEQGFRNFVVDFLGETSSPSESIEEQSAHKTWIKFLQRYLFNFMTKGNEVFRYYMKRKNVEVSKESQAIWSCTKNEAEEKHRAEFRQKYNMRKNKILGGKKRQSKIMPNSIESPFAFQSEQTSNPFPQQNIEQIIKLTMPQHHQPAQMKKHMLFMSSDSIYSLIISKLVQTLREYEKIESENFKLEEIKFGLSNFISILTKLFDFTYLYMYGSMYAMYAYGMEDFYNNKYILSFINYNIIFAVALVGVIAYVGLILFHKQEFTNGSLGVDQNQRTISFSNLKFYTTFLLFLMGSSFSNVFIMTSLNSYMCDQNTLTLWNFPQNQCYTVSHLVEMFGALLILLTYYPLASLIFPFSSAIDRTLEIKYKAEFQIVYLQGKFLVNGINVIFNQLNFQTEELIKSITTTIVCLILAILFHKLKPCSVEYINKIQLKIYIGLVIINAAGILCYFVGLKITIIISGIVLFLYILYLLFSSLKISNTQNNPYNNDVNTLVNDKFKRQEILKMRLQQGQENEPNTDTDSYLIKSKNESLAEDLSQHDLVDKERKFFNVESMSLEPQISQQKTEKFKRKSKSKMGTRVLTIKMEKRTQQNTQKLNILAIHKDPIDMSSAAKKKQKGARHSLFAGMNSKGEN